MLASDPAGILEQIFGRAGIPLTQESTKDDHALSCHARPPFTYQTSVAQQIRVTPGLGPRLAISVSRGAYRPA